MQQTSFFPANSTSSPPAGTIHDLGQTLASYLPDEQVQTVKRAYYFAEQAHEGQRRRSGEPYVTHPLAVAGILANMRMDDQTLLAALLHDVIEDTGLSKQALANQFGDTVAQLVDGVSKLTRIEFESRAEAQAENFQKMALAMAKDIRVIIVKLADRLHNMRTLGALKPEKKRRIARETLEIYAPIAQRLGMHEIRIEFEDLGFAAMYPMRSQRIRAAVAAMRGGDGGKVVDSIKETLETVLGEEGHDVQINGRQKHLYSIYRKMQSKKKPFSDILDIYAFRIIVKTVDDCYRVLGCVHSIYKPVPGQFKDYIAIPKANGYQSLHTVLFGRRGLPIEIQIRTEEMEALAKNGIAAHWLYKSRDESPVSGSHRRANQWVQGLLEMQERASNSLEFIEHVKVDLFPDEVYVFTPRGDIIELPKGATAVDFAFAVHSDIGTSCVACRVDRRLAPLSQALESGQTVEIITAPGAHPNPAWLQTVVTAKARTTIRHYLKHQKRAEALALGKRLLEKALLSLQHSLDEISDKQLDQFLRDNDLSSFDEVLEQIGLGNRVALFTARQLIQDLPKKDDRHRAEDLPEIAIRGTEGFPVTFAKCCYPIPGDHIVGITSAEKGLVVHTEDCHNTIRHRSSPERYVSLTWDEEIEREFTVELNVELSKHRGIIAVLATRIANEDVSLQKMSVEDDDPRTSTITLLLGVRSRVHLARVMKRIRHVPEVIRVQRMHH